MVVTLTCKAVGAARTDKDASRETARAHNADESASKVLVNRLVGAEAEHRAITSVHQEMRLALHRRTMVWGDHKQAQRLMPNMNFIPWVEEQTRLERKHKEHHDKMIANAPVMLAKIKGALGDFTVDPPTLEEIIHGYSVEYYPQPIPSTMDFGEITEEANKYLREKYDYDVRMSYQKAQMDALERLRTPLTNLVERMQAYDERVLKKEAGEDVGKVGVFRDTLMDNICDIGQALESFNLTGDPAIADLAARMKPLMNITVKELRQHPDKRDEARRRAQELIDNVSDWIGPAA